MAADLLANGVDVHDAYVRLFEDQPFGKVQLLGRALATMQRFDGGLVTVCNLTKEDFTETGSEETFTEGIVDFPRAVSGTEVGVLYRELTGEGREHLAKISLRSRPNASTSRRSRAASVAVATARRPARPPTRRSKRRSS